MSETWRSILEAADAINDTLDAGPDTMDALEDKTIESDNAQIDDKELLEELNKLFTPILVMQGYESEIADKVTADISESTVLTEMNMIKFDDPTRMAQLISVCAKLIHKKRNTPEWQLFKKAAAMKTKASLEMQKTSYDEAKTLAQKYLVMVSTTNNSSTARNAANDLLPQTQH